jgi:hypothetical protein
MQSLDVKKLTPQYRMCVGGKTDFYEKKIIRRSAAAMPSAEHCCPGHNFFPFNLELFFSG